jgi:hypothetical protein
MDVRAGLKIVKKVLMNHSFEKDGFEYHFISIESDKEGWSYNIIVNVVLPKKGQSYSTAVFSGHIFEILNNIWKYIGTSFSYSEKILVDGKEPVAQVFVSKEKQKKVISTIRKKYDSIELKTNLGQLKFNIFWRPSEKFYVQEDIYIDFQFIVDISNFSLDGEYVKPNMKLAGDTSGTIFNFMVDNDYFNDSINNVIYEVMGDEMDITSIDDLYYKVIYYIGKFDGMEVNHSYGGEYDLEPEMFNLEAF